MDQGWGGIGPRARLINNLSRINSMGLKSRD